MLDMSMAYCDANTYDNCTSRINGRLLCRAGGASAPFTLTAGDRAELEEVANSTSTPQSIALRARMILASSDGLTNADVARQVGASPQAVGKWRKRYLDGGIESLRD